MRARLFLMLLLLLHSMIYFVSGNHHKEKPPRVILLRGKPASGKSTVAHELLQVWRNATQHKVSLVDWDYIRATMFGMPDNCPIAATTQMLNKSIEVSMKNNFTVIAEGSMWRPSYDTFVFNLWNQYPNRVYTFYWNISLVETLRRHQIRQAANPKQHLSTAQITKLWRPPETEIYPHDYIIQESFGINDTVKFIRSILHM